ncbi:MAG: alcohol dehydrogenase catalytic domain-containing protein [Saprospiraceae bacterium]|nr:alcohol dehydrogenase catalytic domain-containing protein [Saprospiraceae bacterium]
MITVRDVGIPTPGDHQILFRVLAATVNRTDCAILWGKPWIMRYFTVLWKLTCKITGTDFAGRIEAVGRHVSIWRIGDRVWGFKGFGLQSHAQ